MKRKTALFLLILTGLLFAGKSWSAPVKISGKAPGYSSNTIDLYTLHDFISEEKVKLGTLRFSSDGTFTLTTELPILLKPTFVWPTSTVTRE